MGRRVLPALFALAAAVADRHGSHGLAFDALLAAIPFAAVASIAAFAEYLDHRGDTVAAIQALLWGFALAMLVLSCAARSPATETHQLPTLGWSALVACLGVFALKACVAVVPWARRISFVRPAKP